jgi:hypothetical protein
MSAKAAFVRTRGVAADLKISDKQLAARAKRIEEGWTI